MRGVVVGTRVLKTHVCFSEDGLAGFCLFGKEIWGCTCMVALSSYSLLHQQ
jgi:hypothetical protein